MRLSQTCELEDTVSSAPPSSVTPFSSADTFLPCSGLVNKQPRRSNRTRKRASSWWSSFPTVSTHHQALIVTETLFSLGQAFSGANSSSWNMGIDAERKAHPENDTWKFLPKLAGINITTSEMGLQSEGETKYFWETRYLRSKTRCLKISGNKWNWSPQILGSSSWVLPLSDHC